MTARVMAVVLGALILGLSACTKADADNEKATKGPEATPIVSVVKAARADLASDLVLTARIRAFPANKWT